MITKEHIRQEFKDRFSNDPLLIRSPGRINLIGEHTDYNDGFVFPAAINKEIFLAIGKNNSSDIRLYSYDYKQSFNGNLSNIKKSKPQWANYLLGVVYHLLDAGAKIEGFDCVFGGNIPVGAGLSSSAALENALSFGLNELFNLHKDNDSLALIGQKAEHTFVGTKCGIMDQYTSMNGKENQAILLDCRSLDYKLYPINLGDYEIVLVDTKVKHDLASSEYNNRREDCESAVALFQKDHPNIKSLRDANLGLLDTYKDQLNDIVYKRCLYVINENMRTIKAAEALTNNQIELLGDLMYNTHFGLRDNYEVSCKELDYLVNLALESKLAVGARMMGGGFGGCTINIVKKEKKQEFINLITASYTSQFNQEPTIYEVEIVNGTSLV